jgi:hypothetical protein
MTGVMCNLTAVILRMTQVMFNLTAVRSRMTQVLFKLTGVILRMTGVIFNMTPVILRMTQVMFKLTAVILNLTAVSLRMTGVTVTVIASWYSAAVNPASTTADQEGKMPLRPLVSKLCLLACAAALATAGCSNQSDSDSLTTARRHLRMARCGSASTVAGAAGVNADPREVYLGDWVVVAVCHLDEEIKAAEAEQQPITLFIEGLDSGNQPTGVDLDHGILTFTLDRTEANKRLWQPLLYSPLFDRTTSMRVSVGIHGDRPLLRASGSNLTLVFDKLYVNWITWLWLALLVFIAVALWVYARKSDMLRDGPPIGGIRQPYSLARVQMAWWFLLILVGYIFIWLVTGDRDSIPPSLLGMMGISAVTAIAAIAISSRGAGGGARRKLLDEQIAALDEALQQIAIDADDAARRAADPAAPGSATAAALRAALEKKTADLEAMRANLVAERAGLTAVTPSKGFWNDLVTDDRGAVSLDRFQIAAWSLVLGGLFLYSVVWDLTMPEFNATLLALMGISSGTYIGFKLPTSKSEG